MVNMSYQRQSSNGTVIETINGKHYINGVEVETGKLKGSYYFAVIALMVIAFIAGYVVGSIT
jgi:hypothetical protein